MRYLTKVLRNLFDALDSIGIRTYKERTTELSKTLCGLHKFTYQVKREAIRGSSEACYEMYHRRRQGFMSVKDLDDAELWLDKAVRKHDYPDALVCSALNILGAFYDITYPSDDGVTRSYKLKSLTEDDRIKINDALEKLKYALHHFASGDAWDYLFIYYKEERFRKADFKEMVSYEELRTYCLNLILLKSHYEAPYLFDIGWGFLGMKSDELWDRFVEEQIEFFQFTEDELYQNMTEAKFFEIFDRLEFERWFQKMKKDIWETEGRWVKKIDKDEKKNQSTNDDIKRAYISSLSLGDRVKCKFRLSPQTHTYRYLFTSEDIVYLEIPKYRLPSERKEISINQIEWILLKSS